MIIYCIDIFNLDHFYCKFLFKMKLVDGNLKVEKEFF